MKLAIMQPYFYPYLGYFQLIGAVDLFVIYDDVHFINKGYINRNSLLINGKETRITLELMGASQNKLINQIEVGNNASKLLKSIEMAYKKSLSFATVFPVLQKALLCEEKNLAKFIANTLRILCEYLEVPTKFICSSEVAKNNSLKGQEKIIEIAKILKATTYINAIGGQELYDKSAFKNQDIELKFLKPTLPQYKQFNNEFIPFLSVIDVVMFNDKKTILNMLNQYELV